MGQALLVLWVYPNSGKGGGNHLLIRYRGCVGGQTVENIEADGVRMGEEMSEEGRNCKGEEGPGESLINHTGPHGAEGNEGGLRSGILRSLFVGLLGEHTYLSHLGVIA